MNTSQPNQEEWPTSEMFHDAEEHLDDKIDTLYDFLEEEDELLSKIPAKDRPKIKIPIGVINKRTNKVITLGEDYADLSAWRKLNVWDDVFKNPGYHGCAYIDLQILCLPDREDNPWT